MDENSRSMRRSDYGGGYDMTKNQNQRNEEGTGLVIEALRTAELNPGRETDGDNEFKLTVRKLEMPVRPRGVLAE